MEEAFIMLALRWSLDDCQSETSVPPTVRSLWNEELYPDFSEAKWYVNSLNGLALGIGKESWKGLPIRQGIGGSGRDRVA